MDWTTGLECWTVTAHAHENTTHSIRKRSSAASRIVRCEPRGNSHTSFLHCFSWLQGQHNVVIQRSKMLCYKGRTTDP